MKRARAKTKKRKWRIDIVNFRFIGAGSTRQGKLSPVSERHDEALVEALYREEETRVETRGRNPGQTTVLKSANQD